MTKKPTYEELEQSVEALKKDIVKRKQMEATLKSSEKILSAFLNSPADISIITDTAGKVLYSNEFCAERFNRSVDELIGLSVWDLIAETSPIIAEGRKAYTDEVIKTCKPVRFQDEREGMWFDNVYIPILDEQEQVSQVGCFARDISELKQSEKKYRLLADNVTDVIYIVNLDKLRFEYVSPSVETVSGYTVEEVMDFNIYDLLLPHSADLVMETITQEIEKNKYGKAEPQLLELEIVRKDGLKICVGVSARFLRDNKEHVTSILCVARDVSERKKVEEALAKSDINYRLLADNVTDVIWTMDMDMNYTYMSPSITRLHGFTVEEALAMSPEELMTQDSFERIMKAITDELEMHNKGQKPQDRSRKEEAEVYCKDGSMIWTEIEGNFIYDNNGQPKGMIGVNRDITERKNAENVLRQVNTQLEEKVKERTTEIEERNVALKVLLNQRGGDKKKLEEAIMSNVKELLIPNINRLKSSTLSSQQQTALNVLESNLNEIISPFANSASSSYMKLTPTEIQVANFIKNGASSKDIAESLSLSQRTVDTHRYNIRKKIGLSRKGINLRTYLLSMT